MRQIDRLIWLDVYLFRCQKNPQTRPAIINIFNDNESCRPGGEMSYSTLKRDMKTLTRCGAEIRNGRGGWYSTQVAFRCNRKRIKRT